jgi:hypothetical protein
MDPLTALGLTSSLVQTVDRVSKIAAETNALLSNLRAPDDTEAKFIHYKLVAQQHITAGWANRMRLESNSNNEWGYRIPPRSVEQVKQILNEMTRYYTKAQSEIEKMHQVANSASRTRNFAHRYRFARGGYEELLKLTDTLDVMNKSLEAIAPLYLPILKTLLHRRFQMQVRVCCLAISRFSLRITHKY